MATLSKTCESYNFLKLSFTNIWGLHLNFADCESFLESNSPDILPLWETNLDDSIDSANFSVRGYFPLIWKDSSIHMHGLTVYVKEGVPFKWVLSLENSADSYLSFQLVLLHSLSHFFFLFRSSSSFLCAVFGSLSSNFVFGDFNVHHTDWLTYFDGTDRPGELCYNFSISNDLTQMVIFPTQIADCHSHRLFFWISFFLDASICSTMTFPSLGNTDHIAVSVSTDIPSNLQQNALFHHIYSLWLFSSWLGWFL